MKSAEAQPYAIAVKDHSPFTMPGFGKNWKNPTGEWVRTFAVLTTPANELIAMIRDRVPAVLAPEDYDRWLGTEPDLRDLLNPLPSDLMAIWPISTRVNWPSNEERLLEEIELAKAPAAYSARVICGSPSLTSAHKEESDTPIRRTLFGIGN